MPRNQRLDLREVVLLRKVHGPEIESGKQNVVTSSMGFVGIMRLSSGIHATEGRNKHFPDAPRLKSSIKKMMKAQSTRATIEVRHFFF